MSEASTIACSNCQKQYDLTAEYLAANAGGSFACECGTELQVPAQSHQPASGGIWQDNGLVVVARGVRMPSRCCICNEPLQKAPKPKTMRWTPPEHRARGRGILFLVRWLIADSYSEGIVTRIGRCHRHRWELKPRLTGWLMILLGVATMSIYIAASERGASNDILLFIFLSLLLLGTVVTLLPARIRLIEIHKKWAWFRGFGQPYVQSLPLLSEAKEIERASDAAALKRMKEQQAEGD